ncbi:ABC-2 family transporter protein [Candidatus Woesearchaeota archaeon]|nr:ABC-2 family transporter protein [Candidatus Woesearchaeota archaeon]
MYKKIKSIIRMGFKDAVAYRFHFYITLITSPLQLLIYYFLWKAIFSYSGQEIINGFTFELMISYYALNMIIAFFTWSGVEEWLEFDVRNGELVNMLLKPFKVAYFYFFQILGVNSLSIILEMAPFFLIAVFFFGLKIAPVFYFLTFVISIVLAMILNFLISYLVGMTAFWFNRIGGIRRVKRATVVFLSGGMIPLTFFPIAFQKIFNYLPFQYIRFVPINIYLGNYPYLKVLIMIGIQITWILILYAIAEFVWYKAFKKFAGAGA